MDGKTKQKLRKKNLLINVIRNFKNIKNRTKIYNRKNYDVVGVDIKIPIIKMNLKLKTIVQLKNFKKKLQRIIYE